MAEKKFDTDKLIEILEKVKDVIESVLEIIGKRK